MRLGKGFIPRHERCSQHQHCLGSLGSLGILGAGANLFWVVVEGDFYIYLELYPDYPDYPDNVDRTYIFRVWV
jgi:hypothetical protein